MYTSAFNKPMSPVVEILDDFGVLEINIRIHEIVVVTILIVH